MHFCAQCSRCQLVYSPSRFLDLAGKARVLHEVGFGVGEPGNAWMRRKLEGRETTLMFGPAKEEPLVGSESCQSGPPASRTQQTRTARGWMRWLRTSRSVGRPRRATAQGTRASVWRVWAATLDASSPVPRRYLSGIGRSTRGWPSERRGQMTAIIPGYAQPRQCGPHHLQRGNCAL